MKFMFSCFSCFGGASRQDEVVVVPVRSKFNQDKRLAAHRAFLTSAFEIMPTLRVNMASLHRKPGINQQDLIDFLLDGLRGRDRSVFRSVPASPKNPICSLLDEIKKQANLQPDSSFIHVLKKYREDLAADFCDDKDELMIHDKLEGILNKLPKPPIAEIDNAPLTGEKGHKARGSVRQHQDISHRNATNQTFHSLRSGEVQKEIIFRDKVPWLTSNLGNIYVDNNCPIKASSTQALNRSPVTALKSKVANAIPDKAGNEIFHWENELNQLNKKIKEKNDWLFNKDEYAEFANKKTREQSKPKVQKELEQLQVQLSALENKISTHKRALSILSRPNGENVSRN